MREKIFDIIENAHRGLNPKELMDMIKPNNTVDDLRELIHELDLMCRDGILRCTSGNNYVINELLIGTVDMHEKGNAHIIIPEHDDLFIPRDLMRGARDKDTVSVEITDKYKNEGKIIKVLKRAIGKDIGEVINEDGVLKVVPIDKSLPFEVVVEESDVNLVEGLYVHLEYVSDISRDKVLARVDEALGHKNALKNEMGISTEISEIIAQIAVEFGLRLEFPEEVKEEAKTMPEELSSEMIEKGLNEENREDFRNDIVVTIDGKDTKDIDDAISVKILPNGNFELAVHIADVSYYVRPGSALWKEAERRGNSNYLGNKVLPMLPVELSNGICSLNEGVDRFTTSCVMEIDHSGKVVNSRVVKGIIKSRKKMNYDAVQDIIDDKETEDTKDYTTLEYIAKKGETLANIAFANNMTEDELLEYNKGIKVEEGTVVNVPCKNVLKNMHVLSKMISVYKQKRGELTFESDEAKIYQDENDEVVGVEAREQRPAERIIEDFMVAANEQVAIFLNEYGIPTFRIHDHPLQKKMEDYMKFLELLGIHYPGKINVAGASSKECQDLLKYLKNEKAYSILNKKLLRSMQKAVYSTTNIGHFGIASPMYTHFTSPIRRFDDLLNHTSISEILSHNGELDSNFIKSWNAYLTTICEQISECERNSEKCEYAVDDMLKANYMLKHIGEEFEATVDSLMDAAFFVRTDNFIDGRVDVIDRGDKLTSVVGYYDYSDSLMAYTRNGRVDLRYGDRVLVRCIDSDVESREVDFALVRKL